MSASCARFLHLVLREYVPWIFDGLKSDGICSFPALWFSRRPAAVVYPADCIEGP